MSDGKQKPSRAAIKAAERIEAQYMKWYDSGTMDRAASNEQIAHLAAIIDEETGVVELVDACQAALACVGKAEAENIYKDCVSPQIGKVTLEQLTQALADATK